MALFDDKLLLINDAEELFSSGLIDADERLTREIIKIYSAFVKGGLLEIDPVKLAELDDLIVRAVGFTDYRKIANSYLANFEAVEEINLQQQQQLNKLNPKLTGAALAENERIINNLEKVTTQLKGTPTGVTTVVNIVNGKPVLDRVPYRNASLDELIGPLADIMRDDIITGVSFDSAAERISVAIQKNELGLARWAKQISRDGLSQHNGLINNELRKEFKMEYVTYAGSVKDTTRPFCFHVINTQRTFKYADLNELYLNEFIPGGIPSPVRTDQTPTGKEQPKGHGMIPGTNETNFMIRRGGYSCRHEAIPTVAP